MTDLRVIGLLIAVVLGIGSWGLTCAAWRFDEIAAGVLPLEPRSFEGLTLLTLGTGGIYENHLRRGPATAVAGGSAIAVVDAGRAVAEGLREVKIPISQPGTVLLTNLLPENTLGLDDLLVMSWIDGRREPLRLLGPEGTVALARSIEEATRRGTSAVSLALALGAGPPSFDAAEIGDGWSGEIEGIRVTAGDLPGGPTTALAYRFEWNGRSAVVSGTGWAPDALSSFAKGADLLVHEAVMIPTPEQALEMGLDEDPERLRREVALHSSLTQAGAIARRAGVKTLVLVRLRPPPVYDLQITMVVDDQFGGRIVIAEDGDEISP